MTWSCVFTFLWRKQRRVWNRGRREEERQEGKGKGEGRREDTEELGGTGWRGREKRAEWGGKKCEEWRGES